MFRRVSAWTINDIYPNEVGIDIDIVSLLEIQKANLTNQFYTSTTNYIGLTVSLKTIPKSDTT